MKELRKYVFFVVLQIELNHFGSFFVRKQLGDFEAGHQTADVIEKDAIRCKVGRIANEQHFFHLDASTPNQLFNVLLPIVQTVLTAHFYLDNIIVNFHVIDKQFKRLLERFRS